jgi:copper homeostasis protein
MKNDFALEICVDSVASCEAAQAGGATRVELCANLFEGGTTPSAGTIREARRHLSIGLHVIVRPRGGDFCYSAAEFNSIQYDLQVAKDLGADGLVMGILNLDGTIDRKRMEALVEQARPLTLTFHRAFDLTPDPEQALTEIIDLGMDLLLTSGQERTACEGIPLLARLVRQAGERVRIMPGGGISERNLERIVQETGVRDVHLTARQRVPSPMAFRPGHVFMGGELRLPEYDLAVADARLIGRLRQHLSLL